MDANRQVGREVGRQARRVGALLLAVAAGAGLWIGAAHAADGEKDPVPPVKAPADEEASRRAKAAEAVRELLPALASNDVTTRSAAERKLFALGEPARAALDAIARGDDAAASRTASRLLSDARWGDPAAKDAPGAGGDDSDGGFRPLPHDPLARVERRLEALRQRLRDGLGWDFSLEFPELELPDAQELLAPGAAASTSQGRIEENGRLFAWKKEADGSVEVTVRDAPDAKSTLYRAESLEKLREAEPQIAERLDDALSRTRFRSFRLRLPRFTVPWHRGDDALRDGDTSEFEGDLEGDLREWLRPFEGLDGQTPGVEGPTLGIEWTPPAAVLREQLDLGPGAGMVVARVLPGTTAERLGLRRHDVLVELDGKPVGGPADVRAALTSAGADATHTAVVIRRGERVRLEK